MFNAATRLHEENRWCENDVYYETADSILYVLCRKKRMRLPLDYEIFKDNNVKGKEPFSGEHI